MLPSNFIANLRTFQTKHCHRCSVLINGEYVQVLGDGKETSFCTPCAKILGDTNKDMAQFLAARTAIS